MYILSQRISNGMWSYLGHGQEKGPVSRDFGSLFSVHLTHLDPFVKCLIMCEYGVDFARQSDRKFEHFVSIETSRRTKLISVIFKVFVSYNHKNFHEIFRHYFLLGLNILTSFDYS